MERKNIKYIGFYELPNSKADRVCSLAATNKMNYIAHALVEAGYAVDIISPSWMGDKSEIPFEKTKTMILDEFIKITFCPSWKTNNRFTGYLKISVALFWLFLYLLFNTQKNEKVIVYHVQWLSWPIRAAKFIKRFDLILEVEEIYQDVMSTNNRFKKWENELLNQADAFIYSTDLLINKLGNTKPYVVLYGEYKVYEKLSSPTNDGKIHLLYAGIIDEKKRGAFNAVEAAKYLPEHYVLHIIGFGDVDKLMKKINENNKIHKCKIVFDGLKSGNEYIRYCQSCHIGLSTQSMRGDYLESSFPSKILSYLALGLRVVSCEIQCVKESSISDVVTYYTKDDPKAIAEAILKINITQGTIIASKIEHLHNDFKDSLKMFLGEQNANLYR